MRSRVTQRLAQVLGRAEAPRALLADSFKLRGSDAGEKVELPDGFSGHDYAAMLLHIAAEVEHSLLVEYLFAAYSLGGAQVPEAHREEVRDWQTILLGIAKEEMAHFVTVQNVLRLIGAPLNLERDDFPWDLPFAPFKFSLEALTLQTLSRFVYVESPEEWPADAEPFRQTITNLASQGQTRPVNQVGKLYELMMRLLGDKDLIPDSAFQDATLPYQASWDEWGRGYRDGARGAVAPAEKTPDLIIQTCYSRSTAIAALKAVAEQGEAADRDAALDQASHFRRFFNMWKAWPKDGDWSPIRPLADNPTTVDGLADATYIVEPRARSWAQLLNLRYRMLLTFLAHSFRLSGAAGSTASEARGLVLQATFGEMYNLRVVSNLLVGIPVEEGGANLAGPPFEMPYTLNLPPQEADAWRVHLDLITATARLADTLEIGATPEEAAYLTTLRAMDLRKRAAIEDIVNGADARRIRLGGWS